MPDEHVPRAVGVELGRSASTRVELVAGGEVAGLGRRAVALVEVELGERLVEDREGDPTPPRSRPSRLTRQPPFHARKFRTRAASTSTNARRRSSPRGRPRTRAIPRTTSRGARASRCIG